jgi:hypothetical protein
VKDGTPYLAPAAGDVRIDVADGDELDVGERV